MSRPLDVVLCGYYGFGNLGDELMAESLLGLLKKNGVPGERIAILSAAQGVAADRGEASRVDRWSPLEVMSALRSSRTLLLGGGGLFQDSTSTRSCAYYWGVAR
ncbi:MAG: polysaccharide pyruvyl transferase CsaB, partial [Thermovirgaceae bacterium]